LVVHPSPPRLYWAEGIAGITLVKPSPAKLDASDPAGTDDDLEQTVDETPLTPEERARMLAELEAEFEAAERSIRQEGTISSEEFLRQREEYWAAVAKGGNAGRPKRR
jgi:hypothetical protein